MENQKTTPAKSTGQLLFISFAVILAVMSVAKYQSLHSTYFDLGIFLHYHNNIWHGKWWLIIAGHVQPILLLWSWIFSAFPQELAPIILLTGQATALAWPISFLYREYGLIPALAWQVHSNLALAWITNLTNFMNISNFSKKSQRDISGFFLLLIPIIVCRVFELNIMGEQLSIISIFLLTLALVSQFNNEKSFGFISKSAL